MWNWSPWVVYTLSLLETVQAAGWNKINIVLACLKLLSKLIKSKLILIDFEILTKSKKNMYDFVRMESSSKIRLTALFGLEDFTTKRIGIIPPSDRKIEMYDIILFSLIFLLKFSYSYYA